jgi:hypothetical protein
MDWRFQPTVYLSIVSTLMNLMVHYAFTHGVKIAWWTRALKPDTKISQLQQYWEPGNSLLASLKVGRTANVVALASIIVAISQINSPLLQRASRVAVVPTYSDVTVLLGIAPQLPQGYTGLVEGRGNIPSWFTGLLLPTGNEYYDRVRINVNQNGCTGICSTTVSGAGFAIFCSSSESTFDAIGESQPLSVAGVDAFQSNFEWYSTAPNNISINVEFEPDPGCQTRLLVRNCTLNPATVKYNLLIDGNTSTISLPRNSSIYDDKVESTYVIEESYAEGSNTTLGGLALALTSIQFSSKSKIYRRRWMGGIVNWIYIKSIRPTQLNGLFKL